MCTRLYSKSWLYYISKGKYIFLNVDVGRDAIFFNYTKYNAEYWQEQALKLPADQLFFCSDQVMLHTTTTTPL